MPKGFFTDDQLVYVLSQQLNITRLDLSDYKLRIEVLGRIPDLQSRRLNCLVTNEGKHFEVVMADPTDIYAYDQSAVMRLLDQSKDVNAIR